MSLNPQLIYVKWVIAQHLLGRTDRNRTIAHPCTTRLTSTTQYTKTRGQRNLPPSQATWGVGEQCCARDYQMLEKAETETNKVKPSLGKYVWPHEGRLGNRMIDPRRTHSLETPLRLIHDTIRAQCLNYVIPVQFIRKYTQGYGELCHGRNYTSANS